MNTKSVVASVLLLLGFSSQSFAYGPYGPYGYGPGSYPRATGPGQPTAVRFEKDQTEDHYILKIHRKNMSPEDIEIQPSGQGVRISSSRSYHRENRGGPRGYASVSQSSSFSKHIRLPWDADIEGMQRTDADGLTLLEFPKRTEVFRRR